MYIGEKVNIFNVWEKRGQGFFSHSYKKIHVTLHYKYFEYVFKNGII